jgi:hypothetical protein
MFLYVNYDYGSHMVFQKPVTESFIDASRER